MATTHEPLAVRLARTQERTRHHPPPRMARPILRELCIMPPMIGENEESFFQVTNRGSYNPLLSFPQISDEDVRNVLEICGDKVDDSLTEKLKLYNRLRIRGQCNVIASWILCIIPVGFICIDLLRQGFTVAWFVFDGIMLLAILGGVSLGWLLAITIGKPQLTRFFTLVADAESVLRLKSFSAGARSVRFAARSLVRYRSGARYLSWANKADVSDPVDEIWPLLDVDTSRAVGAKAWNLKKEYARFLRDVVALVVIDRLDLISTLRREYDELPRKNKELELKLYLYPAYERDRSEFYFSRITVVISIVAVLISLISLISHS